MRVRLIKGSDLPVLRSMAEASGYPYPDLGADKLEAIRVLVDDEDRPLMAAAARRLVEVYLWCGEFERPLAKLHALRMLHEEMAAILKQLGYCQAEAFLPPSLAKRFARRLEKSFGWRPNWPSWTRGF